MFGLFRSKHDEREKRGAMNETAIKIRLMKADDFDAVKISNRYTFSVPTGFSPSRTINLERTI